VRLTSDWTRPVFDQLDRHLTFDLDRPVAIAVSGGGDSIALMHLASEWARRRARPLLVLTVDHGLNADASAWNAGVAAQARDLGLDWQALVWEGPKPTSGLPAAARAARHRLLAVAARAMGARVILMGHTADDIAEADWMRARGTAMGQLKAWSPSPVWPEGHGLMLLRPLLGVPRQTLRDWLAARRLAWIDDPANSDPRFQRSRARAAGLQPATPTVAEVQPSDLRADPVTGVISGPMETPWLGQAVVCAGGGETIAPARALATLKKRLAGGARAAVLGGARVQVCGSGLVVMREAGRRPPGVQSLPVGEAVLWDGRFAFTALEDGWMVGPAGGRRWRLSPGDRAVLNPLPPPARAVHPILFRHGDARPVLADRQVNSLCLVPGRLRLATAQANSEADLDDRTWRQPDRHPI